MVETTFIFCPSVYDESNRENVRHWCGMLFIFLVSIFIHFIWPIYICGCKQVRTGVSPYHAEVEKSLTEH